jgi:hypothetical protein
MVSSARLVLHHDDVALSQCVMLWYTGISHGGCNPHMSSIHAQTSSRDQCQDVASSPVSVPAPCGFCSTDMTCCSTQTGGILAVPFSVKTQEIVAGRACKPDSFAFLVNGKNMALNLGARIDVCALKASQPDVIRAPGNRMGPFQTDDLEVAKGATLRITLRVKDGADGLAQTAVYVERGWVRLNMD